MRDMPPSSSSSSSLSLYRTRRRVRRVVSCKPVLPASSASAPRFPRVVGLSTAVRVGRRRSVRLLLLLLLLVRHAHAYTHARSRVLLVLVGHAGAGLLRGRVVVVHAQGRGHAVVLLVVGRDVRGYVLGVLGHLVVEPRRAVLRLRLGVECRQ